MLKTARPVDTEALDRLEEKVKLLVALIGRMRSEQARLADEHQKLARELDAARVRLHEADGAAAELAALKDERDLIRTRVSSLLEQLEGLNL